MYVSCSDVSNSIVRVSGVSHIVSSSGVSHSVNGVRRSGVVWAIIVSEAAVT